MSNIIEFNQEELNLIKQQIAPTASALELQFFIQQCKQTGLNPFTRQIYLVGRNVKDPKTGGWATKQTVQISIDGQRLVAQRSGEYEGQIGPLWHSGKEWVDVWLERDLPKAAKVGVLRKGFKEPLWATATWDSYAQYNSKGDLSPMWKKMPDLMIAKCAESLALRKAFPQELSGLYTSEEMGQAEVIREPVTPHAKPKEQLVEKVEKPAPLPIASQGAEPPEPTQDEIPF